MSLGTPRARPREVNEREMNGSSPDVVAEAIHHALTAARPRTRYRAGKHASLLPFLAAILPDRLLDKIRFGITGMPGKFGAVKAA